MIFRLTRILAGLWWGGMTALSFVAVPVIFGSAQDRTEAGRIAAQIFSAQSVWAVGLAFLIWLLAQMDALSKGRRVGKALWLVIILTLINHWGIAPLIVSARSTGGNLALWHGVGSALIFATWLSAAWVNWRLSSRQSVFS